MIRTTYAILLPLMNKAMHYLDRILFPSSNKISITPTCIEKIIHLSPVTFGTAYVSFAD